MRTITRWWRRTIIKVTVYTVVLVYVVAMTCLGADAWTAILVAALAASVGVNAHQWMINER
ncbi:MAG TPA: hypothetical protein VF062_26740 [Candidatus Limnocylindrales bacterium]